MSYSIHYGPAGTADHLKKKSRLGMVGAAVVILVCAAAFGCALPSQVQQLRQVLFPWAEPAVQEAFEEFREDVRQGESFKEAAAAFCLEILDEAEQAQ